MVGFLVLVVLVVEKLFGEVIVFRVETGDGFGDGLWGRLDRPRARRKSPRRWRLRCGLEGCGIGNGLARVGFWWREAVEVGCLVWKIVGRSGLDPGRAAGRGLLVGDAGIAAMIAGEMVVLKSDC